MINTMGPSHHFFRVLRKSQNSASKANLLSESGGLLNRNSNDYLPTIDFRTGNAQSLKIFYRNFLQKPLMGLATHPIGSSIIWNKKLPAILIKMPVSRAIEKKKEAGLQTMQCDSQDHN
jgi:hypothetical protein